jgi:hypothetical protein
MHSDHPAAVTVLRSIAWCLLLLLVAMGSSASAADKKLIYHGWDTRDTAYVRDHWQEMEQMPFDGIAIGVAIDPAAPTIGDGSTANLLGWQTFGSHRFTIADFPDAISDLKTPAWTRFTDNFLPVAIATRDQDAGLTWFDDARWATIENNWRVLVTIAREGGCRGLMLDPEHYDYECELFRYSHHRAQRVDRSFAEYVEQARARGHQLGAAAREIFPDIVVTLLYANALASREVERGHALETTRYALLPAFLDGLMEGGGEQASFHDLWEFGHGYRRAEQFAAGRTELKTRTAAVSGASEAYAARMQPGFSLRIDYGWPRVRWQTRRTWWNYFSPGRLRKSLSLALENSDRYVWLYSEHYPRFFPPRHLPRAYLSAMEAARGGPSSARREKQVPATVENGTGTALSAARPVSPVEAGESSRK